MSIFGLGPNLLGPSSQALAPTIAVRLLAGSLPPLRVGAQANATVVKSSPGQLTLDLDGATLLAEGLPDYPVGTAIPVKVTAYAPGPVLEFDTKAALANKPLLGSSPNMARSTAQQPSSSANQPQVVPHGQPQTILPSSAGIAGNAAISRYAATNLTQTPISAEQLVLQIGQQVTGKVIDRLSAGRVILDVQGKPVEAEVPHDFIVGTRLPLEVASVEPEVVFTILDPKPGTEAEAAKLLRANLASQAPVGSSLQSLRELVSQLTADKAPESLGADLAELKTVVENLADNQAPPSPEKTSAFVRDGGLLYEAKLGQAVAKDPHAPQALVQIAHQDLKGVLLQTVRQARSTPASGEALALADKASSHLSHIETQQALNVLARLHGEPYQFQIPFTENEKPKTAFVSVSPDDRQGHSADNDNKGYDVLLHLDLDNLGSMRIDAHFGGSSMRVVFYADNDRAVNVIRTELPAFQKTLHSLGYRDVLLAAEPATRLSPEKKQRFSGLAGAVPKSVRLVDVRA
jgi:hypothetical protein